MLYLLNSPILTGYGHFSFTGPITIDKAKHMVKGGFVSAIGHASTAGLLSTLLNTPIEVNRARVEMQLGDKALVFRLLVRLEEAKVFFSQEELEKLPFELALLEKVEFPLPSGATVLFESK